MTAARATGPHEGQAVRTTGRPLEEAAAAVVLIHGRGSSAREILRLADEIADPSVACLAPEASGGTWYPYSFLAPIERNEPYLSSALSAVGALVAHIEAAGIAADHLVLVGFSQGACLTTEFVARNPRRYGGVAALTGGLIGPDATPREYEGDLAGTPVFIGSADPDPHIPIERVHESARVLERMGARVTTRIYPGMGHTVNADELEHVRSLVRGIG